MIRALTMLNETGDTTIAWTEDRDLEMQAIIEKKMAEGVSFFIIEPRFGGRTKLEFSSDALKHRHVAIPDEDFAKFVAIPTDQTSSEAKPATAAAVKTPDAKVKSVRKAKTAKEVSKSESVGVRQLRGG